MPLKVELEQGVGRATKLVQQRVVTIVGSHAIERKRIPQVFLNGLEQPFSESAIWPFVSKRGVEKEARQSIGRHVELAWDMNRN